MAGGGLRGGGYGHPRPRRSSRAGRPLFGIFAGPAAQPFTPPLAAMNTPALLTLRRNRCRFCPKGARDLWRLPLIRLRVGQPECPQILAWGRQPPVGGNFQRSPPNRVRVSQPERPQVFAWGGSAAGRKNFQRSPLNRVRVSPRARRGFTQRFSVGDLGGRGGRKLWAVVRLKPPGISSRMRGRKWLSHIGTLERGGAAGSRGPTRRPHGPSARLAGGFKGGGVCREAAASIGTPRPIRADFCRVFKKRLATGRPIGNRGAV